MFLFGLTAQQVSETRGWYDPGWHYDNETVRRQALHLIAPNHFSRQDPGVFTPLHDALLKDGDRFMHLAGLAAYLEADQRLCDLHAHSPEWVSMAILNIAGSGKFSSDRTIAEYAAHIWHVRPCPVE